MGEGGLGEKGTIVVVGSERLKWSYPVIGARDLGIQGEIEVRGGSQLIEDET